mmetsp:Transcript_75928/g.150163  ORF Transcript_75928/g.150163 Transcript_75928/m.150163 type:complete len:355 (-) Transcript_75928:208-1272(-)
MEQLAIDRGNCETCHQCRVLGSKLITLPGTEQEFRCCACIDERGTAPRDGRLSSSLRSRPANWWASSDPPEELADVPPGHMQVKRTVIHAGRNTDCVVVVLDPSRNYFSGHGAEQIWPAAIALSEHLLRSRDSYAGLKVVEIGAGCGLPGMLLGRGGAQVMLTDVPWILPLARYNTEANFTNEDPRRPCIAPLRWGHAEDANSILDVLGTPDLVIGSDVVYREEDFDPLLHSMAALGAKQVVLSVARRECVLRLFLERLADSQWDIVGCSDLVGDGMIWLLHLVPPLERREPVEKQIPVPNLAVLQASASNAEKVMKDAPFMQSSKARVRGRRGRRCKQQPSPSPRDACCSSTV